MVAPSVMKMRSKISFLLLLLGGLLQAATPNMLFNEHQATILAQPSITIDNVYFAQATTPCRNNTASARKNAFERAHLEALRRLVLHIASETIQWPPTYPEELKTQTLDTATALSTLTTTRLNTITLREALQKEINTVHLVIALPKEEAPHINTVSFEQLRTQLLDPQALLAGHLPSYEVLVALHQTLAPLPPPLDRTPWQPLIAKAQLPAPLQRPLTHLAGRYPLGSTCPPQDNAYVEATTAYARGDLKSAYTYALESLTHQWSYDALNMAGNVARRLKKEAEATLYLLHAAYLNPASPHPWIHLAFIARANQMPQTCEACCRAAEARHPDPWTKEQLRLLRQPQDTPPPPTLQKRNTPPKKQEGKVLTIIDEEFLF